MWDAVCTPTGRTGSAFREEDQTQRGIVLSIGDAEEKGHGAELGRS